MNAALWLLRGGVAAIFAWAALTKIADPAGLLAAIRTYRLLPETPALLLALWLPWVELTGALAVFWPRHRRAALAGLLALTGVFLLALAQAWIRGLDIDCGCFGRSAEVRGPEFLPLLARDGVLAGALAWLLWRERRG